MEAPIKRLTIIVLLLFPFLGVVSWAQTSPPMEPSPNAMASPGAGQSTGMMGAPQPPGMAMEQPSIGRPYRYPPWFGSCAEPRRSVRIVAFILRVFLALSGIFALTALGIFLIRRSKPRS
jgi:hypothetical protein